MRSKIVINNNVIEQINTSGYVGCSISHEIKKIAVKTSNL